MKQINKEIMENKQTKTNEKKDKDKSDEETKVNFFFF
jgi:hypothetical protein